MRQKQQFRETGGQNKLDRLQIQTPIRSGSLHSRHERVQKNDSTHFKSNQNNSVSNNKPLYQQTYYISNVRQNYLTLISDNMQILQLPIGLIREDIKLGHPIKLRLQYDTKRQQTDDNKFKSIEKDLYKQFHQKSKRQP